ncbi:senescence-induced receptor-like serine/threonine-protein kinase [Oryza glaberrima]|uniref:senescence-induced receptor-like serine/threonine-protein kinase n=1 Tax=Oryza glaberrima TaxID=4538 RepID=UPI00224C0E89|nr:senescence-induced receptor-like serine/threonine-protein kinase [Oryza glaberrima]
MWSSSLPSYLFTLVTGLLPLLVHSQTASLDEGFISIDCGLSSGSSYLDEKTGLNYTSDDGYIYTGENHNISAEYNGQELFKTGLNLRSFPTGGRNCYTLSPATSGHKYLVRAMFMHGNYDGKGNDLVSSPLVFDVYMGLHFWERISVNNTTKTYIAEMIIVAEVNSISVCLMDIGNGTPFISSLEMRQMKSSLYPAAMTNQSIALQERHSMGASGLLRYPDDPYDRLWWPWEDNSGLLNISTNETIKHYSYDKFEVPSKVLQTAATTAATSISLHFSWAAPTSWPPTEAVPAYYHNMHYTEFLKLHEHEFNTYYNGHLWSTYDNPVMPPYLLAGYKYSTSQSTTDDGFYNMSIIATNTSILPPILGAFEIYYLVQHDDTMTSPEDVDAMMTIKTEYQVKKNWMGDPCLPENYRWTGLNCQSDGVTSGVISLDLSHSDMQGAVSDKFSLLKSLQHLNLSYNDLNGSVPDSLVNLPSLLTLDLSGNHLISTIPEALCTKQSLTLRYDTTNGDPCNEKSPKKKKTAVLSVAIVVPVLMVALLVSTLLVYYFCRKQAPNTLLQCTEVPDTASKEECDDHIHISESDGREFTYKELMEITNNFSVCIGEGGFGPVFHGRLKEGTQVAVKMQSPTSTIGKGTTEFLAEVKSLTTVHHRYLVFLVGYCSNKNHLALIYEYMPNGSLYDHIRGKNAIIQTLRWCNRARIALEAAQGLDYLHTGCVLPIVHSDLKSHNILLGHDMVAKISDFGLSKSYLNTAQSHISVTAAGTLGYIDPEYCLSGRLTISSDVFSFGVVLLEIVTGEPPIIPTTVHIVQRVKEKVAAGNIEAIVDPRFGGEYDTNSVWKVVDIALLCTKEASHERPTMSTVVAELKVALALEKARASGSISDISQGGANFELSINSLLSAR